ncbi:MAG: hypothetical protein E7172_04135 [Firmicutes bacterium]|nr:hypothetical protein [Bacillota bacterium]
MGDIFSILKKDKNEMFSQLSKMDLKYFLCLLNDYKLELRDSLELSEKETFGLEIEVEESDNFTIKNNISNGWYLTEDITLYNGIEICSPILHDNFATWQMVDQICQMVNQSALIDTNCGAHVHIGSQTLGNDFDNWEKFFNLWEAYEHIIFRFCYGQYLTHRPNILDYAQPTSLMYTNNFQFYRRYTNYTLKQIFDEIGYNCNLAVSVFNLSTFNNLNYWKEDFGRFHYGNTIEFRCANGTLNPIIWQNYVNLYFKILNYSKSNNYNFDLIKNRLKTNANLLKNIEFFDYIYLKQALEFSDLIFDNNLDKVYFLKQYLKDFKIEESYYTRTRNFTK